MTSADPTTTRTTKNTDVITAGIEPRRSRAQEAVARAMETPTTISRTERNARLHAAREAIVAYVTSLRDEGFSVTTIVAQVKALVRGAPARSAAALRDALARWTISAYYQAD